MEEEIFKDEFLLDDEPEVPETEDESDDEEDEADPAAEEEI